MLPSPTVVQCSLAHSFKPLWVSWTQKCSFAQVATNYLLFCPLHVVSVQGKIGGNRGWFTPPAPTPCASTELSTHGDPSDCCFLEFQHVCAGGGGGGRTAFGRGVCVCVWRVVLVSRCRSSACCAKVPPRQVPSVLRSLTLAEVRHWRICISVTQFVTTAALDSSHPTSLLYVACAPGRLPRCTDPDTSVDCPLTSPSNAHLLPFCNGTEYIVRDGASPMAFCWLLNLVFCHPPASLQWWVGCTCVALCCCCRTTCAFQYKDPVLREGSVENHELFCDRCRFVFKQPM